MAQDNSYLFMEIHDVEMKIEDKKKRLLASMRFQKDNLERAIFDLENDRLPNSHGVSQGNSFNTDIMCAEINQLDEQLKQLKRLSKHVKFEDVI